MKPKIRIGTDIIEVKRFRDKPIEKNKKFYSSIFSESELKYCKKYSDPYPHLAGIFAAKEATIKCLDKPISMSKIWIKQEKNGKPRVIIPRQKFEPSITISHTELLAVAVAVNFV